MIHLLISEIKYFKIPLVIIGMLPLIFAGYANSNISLFNNVYFLGKYFWSMFVGLGTYIMIFIIWTLREKEKRDRLHSLTPIPAKSISFVRWILGIGPLLFIIIFLVVLNNFLPVEQTVFTNRILVQLGLFFIFLASFEAIMHLDSNLTSKLFHHKGWIKIITALILSFISLGIIALVTKHSDDNSAKYIFNTWSIIIFTFSSVLHSKRKMYI